MLVFFCIYDVIFRSGGDVVGYMVASCTWGVAAIPAPSSGEFMQPAVLCLRWSRDVFRVSSCVREVLLLLVLVAVLQEVSSSFFCSFPYFQSVSYFSFVC